MRRLVPGRIAEDIVGEAQQGAQSFEGGLEHMFVRVEKGSDGTTGF
jgi:hypothetical protein